MVREWREVKNLDLSVGYFANVYAILLVVFVTICIISAIVFSCAGGVSKERTSEADYGAGCGAECGAGCGA